MLKDSLEDFGFCMCPPESTLFMYYEGNETILVVTSTDDFLRACSNEQIFACLRSHMERTVPVTTQDGKVMTYLNMRITQTGKGISIVQTHHTKTSMS